MKSYLYQIDSDVFNIVNRVREYDKNYHIFYNKLHKKYELHYGIGKKSKQMEFEKLSVKTLKNIYISRITKHKAKELFRLMDIKNEMLEQKEKQVQLDKTKYQFNKIYHYLQGHNDLSNAFCDQWY